MSHPTAGAGRGHSGYQFRGWMITTEPDRDTRVLFERLRRHAGEVVQFCDNDNERKHRGDWAALQRQMDKGLHHFVNGEFMDGSGLDVLGHLRDRPKWDLRHHDPFAFECRPTLQGPYLHDVLLPWLRDSLAAGLPIEGHAIRQGTAMRICPLPPIAGYYQVVITTRSAVEAAYDDPSVFWSMFPGVEEYGERLLLTRHLDKHTEDVYLPDAWRESWALARAAKPKQTRFTGFQLYDWNKSWYFGMPQTLRIAGLHPVTKDCELTCVLGPDEHVSGSEIRGLSVMLRTKKLPTGEACETARVVFPDEATARREKRPLLDVGASVGFIDADARLVLIDEADRAKPGETAM